VEEAELVFSTASQEACGRYLAELVASGAAQELVATVGYSLMDRSEEEVRAG